MKTIKNIFISFISITLKRDTIYQNLPNFLHTSAIDVQTHSHMSKKKKKKVSIKYKLPIKKFLALMWHSWFNNHFYIPVYFISQNM